MANKELLLAQTKESFDLRSIVKAQLMERDTILYSH